MGQDHPLPVPGDEAAVADGVMRAAVVQVFAETRKSACRPVVRNRRSHAEEAGPQQIGTEPAVQIGMIKAVLVGSQALIAAVLTGAVVENF